MSWANLNNVQPGCLGMCPNVQPVYMAISRANQNGDFVEQYRSVVYRNQQNIAEQQRIPLTRLCNSNKDVPIKFSVHTEQRGLEINSIKTNVNELLGGKTTHTAAANASFRIENF